ncbi:MAG TPA: hypothetical protein VMJ33_05635 [Gallionella sp.]|nr:hypothetical protein [Gallionella sp.]
MFNMTETNGYLGWCCAERLANGRWSPVIWIERKRDYGKKVADARKHTVQETFSNEEDALDIAKHYFKAHADTNDTGL